MHRNECTLTGPHDLSLQIETLKAENRRLTDLVHSTKTHYEKQLENVVKMFHRLLQKQKDFMKNKLTSALKKAKLFNRQKKRLNVKIADLLKKAKNQKILSEESYDILSSEFESTFNHIVQNEKLNRNRANCGRRYNEEVKKFALTLFYHSPKAYNFCRYVCVVFFSFLYLLFMPILVKGLYFFISQIICL